MAELKSTQVEGLIAVLSPALELAYRDGYSAGNARKHGVASTAGERLYWDTTISQLQALIATATREAYERCLEAVGEDETLDPVILDGVPRYKAGQDMWGDDYVQKVNQDIHMRNQLRAEIRQRLAERGNNGRSGKS